MIQPTTKSNLFGTLVAFAGCGLFIYLAATGKLSSVLVYGFYAFVGISVLYIIMQVIKILWPETNR
jgi:hypothetical protein